MPFTTNCRASFNPGLTSTTSPDLVNVTSTVDEAEFVRLSWDLMDVRPKKVKKIISPIVRDMCVFGLIGVTKFGDFTCIINFCCCTILTTILDLTQVLDIGDTDEKQQLPTDFRFLAAVSNLLFWL